MPGYRDACKIALAELKAGAEDHAADADKFKDRLMKIARTTLSSKLLTHERDWFAALAVDAVTRIKGSLDLELIQIIKKPGGSMRDSYLEEGFLMDKEIGVGQPKRIKNAKIMVANTSMDTDKVKVRRCGCGRAAAAAATIRRSSSVGGVRVCVWLRVLWGSYIVEGGVMISILFCFFLTPLV